jgi:hypothetical protein
LGNEIWLRKEMEKGKKADAPGGMKKLCRVTLDGVSVRFLGSRCSKLLSLGAVGERSPDIGSKLCGMKLHASK